MKSRIKDIATITLNTAYDLVGKTEKVVLGEVNNIQSLGVYPAGKGINVAKVLADLGEKVTVSGFLGKDNQAGFEQLFQQLGLQDQFIRVAGSTRTNIKITESSSLVTDLNFEGYQINADDWERLLQQIENKFQDFGIVAVCGSLPIGISSTQFFELIQRLKQKDIKVVVDSSYQGLIAGLEAKPWLVKPNLSELEICLGKQLRGIDNIIKAGKQIKNLGITNVVISMGEDGAIWFGEQIILAKPPKCLEIVSTVGAGDSMVAGLIYGLNQGWSQIKTLAFASTIAAQAISQSNVGISDFTLLQPMLEQVEIDILSD